jgi:hypothetical protein
MLKKFLTIAIYNKIIRFAFGQFQVLPFINDKLVINLLTEANLNYNY